MGLYISIPLLYLLTKLLDNNVSPTVCAGIYAVLKFVLGFIFGTLIFGNSVMDLLFASIIAFGIALVYFWLLERFEGLVWWLIFIIGAIILFI